jgi:hypothetical protein
MVQCLRKRVWPFLTAGSTKTQQGSAIPLLGSRDMAAVFVIVKGQKPLSIYQ